MKFSLLWVQQSCRDAAKIVVQWFGYFAVLLMLSMPAGMTSKYIFPWWVNGQLPVISPQTSIKEVIQNFGPCDQALYAKAAVIIAKIGTADKELLAIMPNWFPAYSNQALDDILAIWPPGFPALEAAMLKLVGVSGSLVFGLICINCTFWALVFLNFYFLAKSRMPVSCAYISPFIICLSGTFSCNLLHTGVISTESYSISLMCLSFLLLVRSSLENKSWLAICAGVTLALGAYFRGQVEIAGLCLTAVVTVVYLLLYGFAKFFYAGLLRRANFHVPANNAAKLLLLAVIAFHCCTMPYRLYNLDRFQTLSWFRNDRYFKFAWLGRCTPDDYLGGRDVPARLDPKLTQQIRNNVLAYGEKYYNDQYYKWISVKTLLRYPIEWISLKASVVPKLWFHPDYVYASNVFCPLDLENCVLVGIMAMCLALPLISFKNHCFRETDIILLLLFTALIGSNILTSVLIGIEPRYFYIVKAGAFTIFYSLLCVGSNNAQELSAIQ